MDEWIAVAARAVSPGGRLAVVLPAARAGLLAGRLADAGLPPVRLRFVHSRRGGPATRVLLEARAGFAGEAAFEPPLVVHEADGSFTPDVRRMLGEG